MGFEQLASDGCKSELVQNEQLLIDYSSKQNKVENGFQEAKNKSDPKIEIVWKNVVIFIVMHTIALYALYLLVALRLRLVTVFFVMGYLFTTLLGVTAGSHRLWSHRSYTANLPFRILLMIAQTAAVQNDIYIWSRDHRMHHKFTDTDADPHNSTRGFFFSHIGWLMCKKHPDLLAKGNCIDMSDIANDPVVQFQRKYYIPLVLLLNMVIPTFIPCYYFGETFWTSYAICIGRYVLSLHLTWLVNSAAHIIGAKPYDRNIKPTDSSLLICLGIGEFFHNYHHTFPYDYKASEFGNYMFNHTLYLIDFMAKIGWASNLKTASYDVIKQRAQRTGDNSWKDSH